MSDEYPDAWAPATQSIEQKRIISAASQQCTFQYADCTGRAATTASASIVINEQRAACQNCASTRRRLRR